MKLSNCALPHSPLIDRAPTPTVPFVMVLSVIEMDSVAPELIAVMGAAAAVPVVILLMVFCEMMLAPAEMDIAVIAADPPNQVSKVLLLKILFKLVFEFTHPVKAVAPVTVTFEKLL